MTIHEKELRNLNRTVKIQALLCEKLSREYQKLIDELKELPPNEILERACEKVVKEKIVESIKDENATTYSQAKAIHAMDEPLDELYQIWMDSDYSNDQPVKDFVRDGAAIIKDYHIKITGMEKEIKRTDEMGSSIDEWHENYYRSLKDCRAAIIEDYAMSMAYNNGNFQPYIDNLIGTHGLERVSLLISNTVRNAVWDIRYYRDVKEWAKNYPKIKQPSFLPEGKKRNFLELCLDTQPAILNQVAKAIMQKERGITQSKKEMER